MNNSCFYRKFKMINIIFFVTLILLFYLTTGIPCNAQQLRYGSLRVESDPSGAKVFLDNDYKGETPLNLKEISVGQYSLKLILSGYEEYNSTIAILPILTVKLSVDLVPEPQAQDAYGSIAVNSNPQEARVYLDNAYKGQTPVNLRELPVGRHTVKLLLPGYQEWSREITVSPSQTARISANLIVQPNYGSISIYSNPRGADIYIDDVYEGLTPLELNEISVGTHTIKLVMPGYQGWIQEIYISSSQVERISVDLEPETSYGSIVVSCDQGGAKIFLNGTFKKATSDVSSSTILENIEAGYYELIIIKDGFRAWIEDIEVFAEEETLVEAQMREILY